MMAYQGRGFGYMKNLPTSQQPPVTVNNNVEFNDDLWGEDLPMDMLDEALDMVTQVEQSQTSLVKHASQVQPIQKTNGPSRSYASVTSGSKKPTVPLSVPPSVQKKDVVFPFQSNGYPKTSTYQPQNVHNNKQMTNQIIAASSTVAGNTQAVMLQEELQKLKEENKVMVEENFAKIGEATILRTEIQRLRTTEETLRAETQSALDQLKRKTDFQHLEHVREIETLKTDLRFKDTELENLREKCMKIEQGKGITPAQKPDVRIANLSQKNQVFLNGSKSAFDTVNERKSIKLKNKIVQVNNLPDRFCLRLKCSIQSSLVRTQDKRSKVEELADQVLTFLGSDHLPNALKTWHETAVSMPVIEIPSIECNGAVLSDLLCHVQCTLALLSSIYNANLRNPNLVLIVPEAVMETFILAIDVTFSIYLDWTGHEDENDWRAGFSLFQQCAYFLSHVAVKSTSLVKISRINLGLKQKLWNFLRAFPDPRFREKKLECSPVIIPIPS